jgi:hypothetical protein
MTALDPLARTPAEHFRLHFFGAVLHLRRHASEERFPFLRDYCAEPDAAGLGDPAAWDRARARWEDGARLPLTRLGLPHGGLRALFVTGLADEDARFGAVFEQFTGHARPTPGLLHAWWPETRQPLRRLAELGLAEAADSDSPRADSPLRVPAVAWDAIRGEAPGPLVGWARHRARHELPELAELILADGVRAELERAPRVLTSGAADALVVRGPAAGGRRSVVAAVARAAGRGLLELSDLTEDDTRWRIAGSLATLLDAMPAVVLDVPPGDTFRVPTLDGWVGPLGIVAGRTGGVAGPALERAVTVVLDVPSVADRARHWAAALAPDAPVASNGGRPGLPPAALAARYRMTGGNIRRTAALARAHAALAGRAEPTGADVARGARALHSRLLDTLAVRVTTELDWERVAVRPETLEELRLLEARCRHRERVGEVLGAAAGGPTAGVRALFTGPSGTGKTLAARTLAGVLDVDLYRIDLSTVVNKYLGETEKNLDRLFSRAEEADAALLLDEGDALMTRRTDVQTSNDRYANLETNFLLQRLEAFDGILLITSNAGERIDDAFRRRMDVVVDFALPDELERWSIWRLHLPDQHTVDDALLEELALRCALSGAQMRNAVVHASLLALEENCALGSGHLDAAVRREYVKCGEICPLAAEVRVA